MVENQIIKVNSLKYDINFNRSWNAELISTNTFNVLLKGIFNQPVKHSLLGVITSGTISLELFWFDKWFNHFIFYSPDGIFLNHYINICEPPVFDSNELYYTDLEADVVVWPDGKYEFVDIEDFNSLQLNGHLESVGFEKARTTLDRIRLAAENGFFTSKADPLDLAFELGKLV
jgi:protein associated with RNAse G/E